MRKNPVLLAWHVSVTFTSVDQPNRQFIMEDINQKAIDTIRTLSADIVQKAKSGHPGAPMGMSAMAHVLFSRHLRFNPKNPHWV
jgi:transketolase N-terminal domain/subunit